ncbi:hypothetical protein [Natronococcus wangiae]|uniref:hypothetical protein n=1 Tax=Natronococcus wangiae TaxID=3068275 RepID=UPI00273FA71F|nr:hypothetical protein [Natronococcus sp. AD5]
MLESVPAAVETAIYLYFLVVAAIGLSLHWRLWRVSRAGGTAAEGEPPHAEAERTVD